MSIAIATIMDIPKIQEVVAKCWPSAYGAILSKDQMDYMVEQMYSDLVLSTRMSQPNHVFFLIYSDETCIGFAEVEHNYLGEKVTRLHKLYLTSQSQGKGVGKALLQKVLEVAKEEGSQRVSLNVNRHNEHAIEFYKRMKFEIAGQEDIDIGNGYFMNDFKMELRL